MRATASRLTMFGAAIVVGVVLSGCTGPSSPEASPAATVASPTSSGLGFPATPDPSASAPSPTASAQADPERCTVPELAGSLGEGGGGAAGSVGVSLRLTNESDRTCTLQGWPGVSFVGNGDGTQIGAPAKLDPEASNGTVTLSPGATASAMLLITQAANYPEDACRAQTPDGFRVYPPGSTESLFIATNGDTFKACADPQSPQLTVQALTRG